MEKKKDNVIRKSGRYPWGYETILKTEYNEKFDELRKNRVVTSFHKYGPIAINYEKGLTDGIGCLKLCLDKYEKTGNTEYLVDAANYAMFEYMYPQHKNAHFRPTDSNESAGKVGFCINDMKDENVD